MSAVAISCESMRPVLPFPREAAAAQVLLLDEDSAGLADQLRRAFPAPGFRVQVAGAGPAALRYVRADSPDVVILVPGPGTPSGLDVYRQIRQVNGRVPVIFVNGARRADAAIEAMKHGAYDFLFHPVGAPELRRVVGEALDVA